MIGYSNVSVDDLLSYFKGAYSLRTLKGYGSDLGTFIKWCSDQPCSWLPAEPRSVAKFIDDQVQRHSVSTIKRRLCAIAFAHRLEDLPVPTDHKRVHLAVRRASRLKPRRPKQVRGLTRTILRESSPPARNSSGLRDAALISVGTTRFAELRTCLNGGEHVRFEKDGTATIFIPRSKSDTAGDGRIAYLSPETAAALSRWLDASGLQSGPLFRALHLNRPSDGPCHIFDPADHQTRYTAVRPRCFHCKRAFRPLHANRRSARHDGRRLRRTCHHAGRRLEVSQCSVAICRACGNP